MCPRSSRKSSTAAAGGDVRLPGPVLSPSPPRSRFFSGMWAPLASFVECVRDSLRLELQDPSSSSQHGSSCEFAPVLTSAHANLCSSRTGSPLTSREKPKRNSTCVWRAILQGVAQSDRAGIAVSFGANHPVLSTVPILLASPAAPYALTAARRRLRVAQAVLWLVTSGTFRCHPACRNKQNGSG